MPMLCWRRRVLGVGGGAGLYYDLLHAICSLLGGATSDDILALGPLPLSPVPPDGVQFSLADAASFASPPHVSQPFKATIPSDDTVSVTRPLAREAKLHERAAEEVAINNMLNAKSDWQGHRESYGKGGKGGKGGRQEGSPGGEKVGSLHHGMERVLPTGYVCHRCNKSGHFIQNCPTNGDPTFNHCRPKKPVGIPTSMLVAVDAASTVARKGNLLLPGGQLAVMKPNDEVFDKATAESRAGSELAGEVPDELKCPICNSLFKQAVFLPCCTNSCCEDCAFGCLKCQICHKDIVGSVLPNKRLRSTVQDYVSRSLRNHHGGAQDPFVAVAADHEKEVAKPATLYNPPSMEDRRRDHGTDGKGKGNGKGKGGKGKGDFGKGMKGGHPQFYDEFGPFGPGMHGPPSHMMPHPHMLGGFQGPHGFFGPHGYPGDAFSSHMPPHMMGGPMFGGGPPVMSKEEFVRRQDNMRRMKNRELNERDWSGSEGSDVEPGSRRRSAGYEKRSNSEQQEADKHSSKERDYRRKKRSSSKKRHKSGNPRAEDNGIDTVQTKEEDFVDDNLTAGDMSRVDQCDDDSVGKHSKRPREQRLHKEKRYKREAS